MWQRLLERFVPLLPAEPSRLDRLDGVGRAANPRLEAPVRRPEQPTRR